MEPGRTDLQFAVEIVDRTAKKLDVPQRHQQARSRRLGQASGQQAAVYRHRLGAVLAQVHGMKPATAAKRVGQSAMRLRPGHDSGIVPAQDALQQAHAAGVRDQIEDTRVDGHQVSPGLVSSSASTKLQSTPTATVIPIAFSTGSVEKDSSANTISVEMEQTRTA
jgi:hypothetical protein